MNPDVSSFPFPTTGDIIPLPNIRETTVQFQKSVSFQLEVFHENCIAIALNKRQNLDTPVDDTCVQKYYNMFLKDRIHFYISYNVKHLKI